MNAILPDNAVILIAEDRADDVDLIRQGLANANLANRVMVVRDGEEALAYLDGSGNYANRTLYPVPDMLLLDLKMPRMDGFEVLRELHKRPALAPMRIVVLTSSEDI